MYKKQATLSYYAAMLPGMVKVKVHREEDGSYWAKLVDFPGAGTQGKDFSDLMEMIWSAIYIVHDIPEEYHPFMPRYIPPQIKDELEREQMQNQFNEIIARQIGGTRELEFARNG